MTTGLALTRLSDVKPERVEWIWDGRLPVGKIAAQVSASGVHPFAISGGDQLLHRRRGAVASTRIGTPLLLMSGVRVALRQPHRPALVRFRFPLGT